MALYILCIHDNSAHILLQKTFLAVLNKIGTSIFMIMDIFGGNPKISRTDPIDKEPGHRC